MSNNYLGIPKTSPLYYTGKGKLDEKSYVSDYSGLIVLNKDYYNIGDTVTLIDTGDVYKLIKNKDESLSWVITSDCGTWN